jgi:hypothetical protein
MSNTKIMTAKEWHDFKDIHFPISIEEMQQYAEYFHAEKMHTYTGDQLQAAKEYSKRCINAHHRNMVEAAWIAGNNAKTSDAVFVPIDDNTPVGVHILLLCTGRQRNIVIGTKNNDKGYPYSSWDFYEDEDVNVIGWMPLPKQHLYSKAEIPSDAVEFMNWAAKKAIFSYSTLSNKYGKMTIEQLYSQFQNRDK